LKRAFGGLFPNDVQTEFSEFALKVGLSAPIGLAVAIGQPILFEMPEGLAPDWLIIESWWGARSGTGRRRWIDDPPYIGFVSPKVPIEIADAIVRAIERQLPNVQIADRLLNRVNVPRVAIARDASQSDFVTFNVPIKRIQGLACGRVFGCLDGPLKGAPQLPVAKPVYRNNLICECGPFQISGAEQEAKHLRGRNKFGIIVVHANSPPTARRVGAGKTSRR